MMAMRSIHTRGPAAEKLLLPKLLCVHVITYKIILSDVDRSWGRTVSTVSWMSEARYDNTAQNSSDNLH